MLWILKILPWRPQRDTWFRRGSQSVKSFTNVSLRNIRLSVNSSSFFFRDICVHLCTYIVLDSSDLSICNGDRSSEKFLSFYKETMENRAMFTLAWNSWQTSVLWEKDKREKISFFFPTSREFADEKLFRKNWTFVANFENEKIELNLSIS